MDISGLKKNALNIETLNQDAIDGVQEIPDYSGNSETAGLTQQLENDYGVRVMFGEDIFGTNDLGYEIAGTDEDTAYKYMLKLGDYFDCYPKGLLKEAGLGRPLVIYLCDKIKNNIAGLSTYGGGYNIIYMQESEISSGKQAKSNKKSFSQSRWYLLKAAAFLIAGFLLSGITAAAAIGILGRFERMKNMRITY